MRSQRGFQRLLRGKPISFGGCGQLLDRRQTSIGCHNLRLPRRYIQGRVGQRLFDGSTFGGKPCQPRLGIAGLLAQRRQRGAGIGTFASFIASGAGVLP